VDFADLAQVIYPGESGEAAEKRRAFFENTAATEGGQYRLDFGEPVLYIKPSSEWTLEERMAVKSVKMNHGKGGTDIDLQLHDKLAAIKALADIIGLTRNTVEVTGSNGPVSINVSYGEVLEEAREKASLSEGHDDE
jgi:hypothetical protein